MSVCQTALHLAGCAALQTAVAATAMTQQHETATGTACVMTSICARLCPLSSALQWMAPTATMVWSCARTVGCGRQGGAGLLAASLGRRLTLRAASAARMV